MSAVASSPLASSPSRDGGPQQCFLLAQGGTQSPSWNMSEGSMLSGPREFVASASRRGELLRGDLHVASAVNRTQIRKSVALLSGPTAKV